jgi:hypothetical protein
MRPEPWVGYTVIDELHVGNVEGWLWELLGDDRLLSPDQRGRLEEQATRVIKSALKDDRVEVNGILMSIGEWKVYIEDCPHEHFTHPGVTLMDGSRMSICNRCKYIQHEAIAKMIEGEET